MKIVKTRMRKAKTQNELRANKKTELDETLSKIDATEQKLKQTEQKLSDALAKGNTNPDIVALMEHTRFMREAVQILAEACRSRQHRDGKVVPLRRNENLKKRLAKLEKKYLSDDDIP